MALLGLPAETGGSLPGGSERDHWGQPRLSPQQQLHGLGLVDAVAGDRRLTLPQSPLGTTGSPKLSSCLLLTLPACLPHRSASTVPFQLSALWVLPASNPGPQPS